MSSEPSSKTDILESDRKLFDPDAWLSAAVTLDVFSTRLSKLEESGLGANELVYEAIEVGLLGGLDDLEVETLLAVAASEVGEARAEIAPLLVQPRDVQRAVRLLRDGAQALVREARLEIEAAALTTYRQA